ncbi:MAG: ribokinase [Oscillibacter sp.]|jgi:ribokinase|nr:ribokinase [Oscillibacter sp.]
MNHKIVVFGSVNRDHVYTVDHLVEPGETISSSEVHIYWGGKGLNQSIALARAGAPTVLAAKIHPDEDAGLRELCRESGVDDSLVRRADAPTGHAIIQIDRTGRNGIFVYPGANGTVDADDIGATLSHMEPGDLLLLQNEISRIPEIIAAAHRRGVKVILNPSPVSEEMRCWPLELVDILIVNETEGAALSREKTPEEILDWFKKQYPSGAVILTLGEDGSYYQDAGRRIFQSAFPVSAVDTTAAGDTFTGFFLARMLSGADTQLCLRAAARASSIAVSRKGATVSIPTLREVLEAEG